MKLHLSLITVFLFLLKTKLQALQPLGLFFGSNADDIMMNPYKTKKFQKDASHFRTTLYNFKNSQYYMKIFIGNE